MATDTNVRSNSSLSVSVAPLPPARLRSRRAEYEDAEDLRILMLRFHFLDAVRVAYPEGFKPKEEESDSDSDSDSDLDFESDSDSDEDGDENEDSSKGKNKENERPETPPPPAAGDDPDSTKEATVPSEPNHSEIVVETPKKHWKREFVVVYKEKQQKPTYTEPRPGDGEVFPGLASRWAAFDPATVGLVW